MKQKRGLKKLLILTILIIPLILTSYLVIAEEGTEVEKSYSCLKDKLGSNCGNSQNTEEISFNLMAMAYDSAIQSSCKSSLKEKKSNDCWGETENTACKLKSTSLAILALNNIEEDVSSYVDWLIDKRKVETSLVWFLEIDTNNKSECTINGKKITIEENKKISGSNPAGLSKAYNDYWFKVNDITQNYTISCDEDFITTLLYQRPKSDVYHVSSQTNSAPAHDSLTEKVNSYCFTTSSECDYEGSLWATLALAKVGEDISLYLPYISAMSSDSSTKKYLPSAFLYMLTNEDDYYSELISQQKQGKYWEEDKNKLYDTSVAILALEGLGIEEVTNAKQYLLDIREQSGCWVSNGAFILYAGWPKVAYKSSKSTTADCGTYNYYCVSPGECSLDKTLDNFYCSALSDICCETKPTEENCQEKGGIVCSLNQECTEQETIAGDTNYCCLGSCTEITKENECEDLGYYCKDACSDNQEEKTSYSDACDFGQKCCGDKQQTSSSNSWLIIILIIILIILVLLAIIFRNKLRVLIFKNKSDYRTGKGPNATNRPSSPPPGFGPMSRPPSYARPPMRRAVGTSRSPKDRDFEETMRKLREMSK